MSFSCSGKKGTYFRCQLCRQPSWEGKRLRCPQTVIAKPAGLWQSPAGQLFAYRAPINIVHPGCSMLISLYENLTAQQEIPTLAMLARNDRVFLGEAELRDAQTHGVKGGSRPSPTRTNYIQHYALCTQHFPLSTARGALGSNNCIIAEESCSFLVSARKEPKKPT